MVLPDLLAHRPLLGRRILLVEDEMIIAELLGIELAGLGCEIAGHATSVGQALELAASEGIDVAILDLNVGGRDVYPVAGKLAERGIPFAFVTGQRADGIEEVYRQRPILQKPFGIEQLERILELMLNQPTG
jgi:CheY-like chemotaxis protein